MHSMQPVFLGLERAYWQRRGAFARVYYGILSAIRQRVNKPTTAKSLASVVTWDGGGAHANSRWNEELVRTERESERERVLYSRTV